MAGRKRRKAVHSIVPVDVAGSLSSMCPTDRIWSRRPQ